MNTKLNLMQWTMASLAVFVIITIFTFVMIRLGVEPWVSPIPQDQVTLTDRIATYLSRLILAGLFTYIFTKTTYEDKSSIGHGLRYGFGMGLLMFVPNFVARIVHADSPITVQGTFMVVGVIQSIVCGAAMAYLYKSDKPKNS
ncbi:MAG: hypothetical protein Q8L88_07540 [Bacteroidota bacterium]|nr:hypothetical protein [Bacteroidota bacterium]